MHTQCIMAKRHCATTTSRCLIILCILWTLALVPSQLPGLAHVQSLRNEAQPACTVLVAVGTAVKALAQCPAFTLVLTRLGTHTSTHINIIRRLINQVQAHAEHLDLDFGRYTWFSASYGLVQPATVLTAKAIYSDAHA